MIDPGKTTVSSQEFLAWIEKPMEEIQVPGSSYDIVEELAARTTFTDADGLTETPAPNPAAPAAPTDTSKGPLPYKDAYTFMATFCEEFELYPWQVEELLRLSGHVDPLISDEVVLPTAENPMLYNLPATNGSGKDNVILAGFILWFISCKVRSTVIATSFSAGQIEAQTFDHCKYYAARINEKLGEEIFDVVHCHLRVPRTSSEARMFVTNEAGRAEGFHAKGGNEFAFIVNESKSITDELYKGFTRYSGWNYWIEVSSTGGKTGHFYRKCKSADAVHYPAPLVLGREYVRYIKISDCPHLLRGNVRIKQIEFMFGKDSPTFRSVVNSEFADDDGIRTLIKQAATEYANPVSNAFDMPLCCGVDPALGGDECVISIWQGNRRIVQRIFLERYEPMLHTKLISVFKEFNLQGEQIVVDAGGLGKPIVHRLIDAGWNVNAFNFGGSAKDKRYFLNRGAELWHWLKRLVEEQLIELPREDQLFMEQLVQRRFDETNGKIKLEAKEDVKLRGEKSPDRVDAAVMAFSLYDFDTLYAKIDEGVKAAQPPEAPRTYTFEEANDIIRRHQYNPDLRNQNRFFVGNQTGRTAGTLCQLLGIKMRRHH